MSMNKITSKHYRKTIPSSTILRLLLFCCNTPSRSFRFLPISFVFSSKYLFASDIVCSMLHQPMSSYFPHLDPLSMPIQSPRPSSTYLLHKKPRPHIHQHHLRARQPARHVQTRCQRHQYLLSSLLSIDASFYASRAIAEAGAGAAELCEGVVEVGELVVELALHGGELLGC